MHSSRVVLLESNEEGLIVLILAGLPFALADSVQTGRRLLASSDKTVGGSCCGSNSNIRRTDNGESTELRTPDKNTPVGLVL